MKFREPEGYYPWWAPCRRSAQHECNLRNHLVPKAIAQNRPVCTIQIETALASTNKDKKKTARAQRALERFLTHAHLSSARVTSWG